MNGQFLVGQCRICDPVWAANTLAPACEPIDCVCKCGVEQKVQKLENGYCIRYFQNGQEIIPSITGTANAYLSGPLSGLPCDFDSSNPERVRPLNTEI